jgi:hypothetical protein
MPTSTSRLAYEDCYEILNMAVEDEAGARVRVPDRRDAVTLRVRLHTARRIDREENRLTYDKDHPLHGKSVYDKLVVRIKDLEEAIYLYIEKIHLNTHVEPLSSLSAPKQMLIGPPQQTVQVQRIGWRRA